MILETCVKIFKYFIKHHKKLENFNKLSQNFYLKFLRYSEGVIFMMLLK